MKKIGNKLKRALAYLSALTVLASTLAVTVFADTETAELDSDFTEFADDYTHLFPGLSGTKLALSDPKFSEKEWYEYIDYELYSTVPKDSDGIAYRIYQPVDYSAASIMAITDYNPKEVLGQSVPMSLGNEMQSIFNMAAQGGNISSAFAGLDVAGGIAETMQSVSDIMDNSKYYSNSSFLGIPGDEKYTGVSNDGFYNADSLSIEIVESETISTGKTIAVSSDYSVSETYASQKDYSSYREIGSSNSQTHEEGAAVGQALSESTSVSDEISKSIGEVIGYEIISETAKTAEKHHEETDSIEAGLSLTESFSETISASETLGVEVTEEAGIGIDGIASAKGSVTESASATVGVSSEIGFSAQETLSTGHSTTDGWSNSVTNSVSIGQTQEHSEETGQSHAVSSEKSIQQNLEHSTSDSSTIEKMMTNGDTTSTGSEHAMDTSVNLGYGVDYQYGNEHSLSVGVTREFAAREDALVKNVGWKLCEYIVKIPYYIEAVQVDSEGNETVLYGQYVNYNLLNGVCRVFANGFIEHWYTGELVTYADFFDGFITASQLVDTAKTQQKQTAKGGN